MLRRLTAAIVALAVAMQPALADSSYFFRYAGGPTALPGGPDPEQPGDPLPGFDITARFIGIVGEPVENVVPVKAGGFVSRWTIQSGRLPQGLSLDLDTGMITGIPVRQQAASIALIGYGPDGEPSTRASVTFEVFEPSGTVRKIDAYAHEGYGFSADIASSTVHEWQPVRPLPEWMTASSKLLHGTPPEGSEGVYAIALSGIDYLGNQIAFAYGSVTVEKGPNVAWIDDVILHPSEAFEVHGRVKRRVGELRWSVEGSLPANLRISAKDGEIFGRIPTFSTTSEIRLVAMDSDGAVGRSNWFRIGTVDPAVALDEARDRALVVGEFASFRFTAADVAGDAEWSIVEGTLPQGLSIDPSTGTISGVPEKVERQEGIVVAVASANGSDSSNPFAIEVFPAPITAVSAPMAVRVDEPFSTEPPTVTGADAPWTFAVADGFEMHPGLSFDELTGVVSGTALSPGSHSVPYIVTDAGGRTSRVFTAVVDSYAPLAIGVDSQSYSFPRMSPIEPIRPTVAEDSLVPSADGRFGTFSLSGTLPAGLSFNPSTGTISGTPVAEGPYGPFVITVVDGSGESASTLPFSITVTPRLGLVAKAATTTLTAYQGGFVVLGEAENAVGNVTWSLDEGTLPAGTTLLADGRLSGTATAVGSYPGVVLRATDEEGATALTEPFVIDVVPPEALGIEAELEWTAGKAFSFQLEADNGAGDVTYSAVSALPAGVSLSPSGILSGTVSDPGSHRIDLALTDELGREGTGFVDLTLLPAMEMEIPASHSLPRGSFAEIVPAVTNAVGDVFFSKTGVLPDGMEFDSVTGAIYGTPEKEGMWNGIVVTATDEAGNVRQASLSVTVTPRQPLAVAYDFPNPLVINSSQGLPVLPKEPVNAVGGVEYSVSGVLPAGLTFSKATGAFGGIPVQLGIFDGIVVTATDGEGATASTPPFSIVVSTNMQMKAVDQDRTVRNGSYIDSGPISVSNAVPPVTFTARSALPAGLSLIASDGSLQGASAPIGDHVIKMRATDAIGRSDDFNLVLRVVGDLGLAYGNQNLNRYAPASIAPAISNQIGEASFELVSGTLPAGLSLDPATGVISGVPLEEGTASGLVVAVTDQGLVGNTASSPAFSITVGARLPLSVQVPAGNSVIANQPYELTLKADNAVGQVSWSMSGELPPGLTFDAAGGRVHGVATDIGVWGGVSFTATDEAGGTATVSGVSFSSYTDGLPIRLVTYGLKTKPGYAFATRPPKVSNAVGDVTFSADGLATYGLSLDPETGVISGTAGQAAEIVVDLRVTDSSNRLTSEPVTITVIPNIRVTMREETDLAVSTEMAALKPVTDYAIGSVTYELFGTLPQGLTFSPSLGRISGTPVELGTFAGLYVRATDSVGDSAVSDEFRITVHENGVIPSVTKPNPPLARAGISTVDITVSWSPKKVGDVVSLNKPLPEGLTLDPATGRIYGVPAIGTHGLHEGYIVSVTDAAGMTGHSAEFDFRIRHHETDAFKNQVITVRAGQPFESALPFSVEGSVPDAVIGEVSYRKNGSSWQSSVDLDPETGVVFGSVSSNRTLQVMPSDALGDLDSFSVTVNVVNLALSYPGDVVSIEVGEEAVSHDPILTNAFGTVRYEHSSGTLPAGLSIDPETGRLVGVPTERMPTGYVSVTATDDFGSATGGFRLKVVDTVPDPFSWPDLVDQEPSQNIYSEFISLSGFADATQATVTSTNGTAGLRVCSSPTYCSFYSEGEVATISPTKMVHLWVKSGTYGETVSVTATIGGVSSTWQVTSREADIMPDPFSLQDVSDALRNQQVLSEWVQVIGLKDDTEITVEGPPGTFYEVGSTPRNVLANREAGTSATIKNEWYFRIRLKSSNAYGGEVKATVTVGDYTTVWTVTTLEQSTMPDPFSFADVTEAVPDEVLVSEIVQITGISDPVTAKIVSTDASWAQVARCSSPRNTSCWYGSSVTVQPGEYEYVSLRIKTGDNGTTSVTRVKVGDREVEWKVAVRPLTDITPDPIVIPDKLDAIPSGRYTSDGIRVTGLIDPVPFSISGPGDPQVCVNGSCRSSSDWMQSGKVANNASIHVSMTASPVNGESRTAELTIGDSTFYWKVTTRDLKMPDDFSFTPAVDKAPGALVISPTVYISGILDPVPVSIAGPPSARFCLNNYCGSNSHHWRSTPLKMSNGPLQLRVNASTVPGDTVKVYVTVGGMTREWTVTTAGP